MSVIIVLSWMPCLSNSTVLPDTINNKARALTASDRIEYFSYLLWELRSEFPEISVELGDNVIDLLEKEGKQKETPAIYNKLGAIHINYLNDISQSLWYINKARELSLQFKDSIELAFAYNNLGDLYHITNNKLLAIKYARMSNELFNTINHDEGIAYSLTNLGEAYFINNEYEKALSKFKLLHSVEVRQNNKSGQLTALVEIANCFLKIDELDSALFYLNQGCSMQNESLSEKFFPSCYLGKGEVASRLGQVGLANFWYQKALSIYREKRIKHGLLDCLQDYALFKSKTNDLDGAKNLMDEAIILASKDEYKSHQLNVLHNAAIFNLNIGNKELSNQYYEEYIYLADSLFYAKNLETIEELQHNLEADYTIELINNDLKLKRKNQFFFLWIITLLVVFGVILYWRNILFKKQTIRLKELNEAKNKLFTVISHDIKSPFSGILGISNLLEEHFKGYEDSPEKFYSKTLNDSIKDLYNLIINLLEWSRSQSDRIVLNFSSINLYNLIEEIIAIQKAQAELKNIELENLINPDTLVYIDKDSMYLVFSNLLSNAIKFTRENGIVKITAFKSNKRMDVIIRDNGIGISKERLASLFKLSECYSTPGTDNEKGTGLGLILSKELVEKNGGSIHMSSELNVGTKFTVRIPNK